MISSQSASFQNITSTPALSIWLPPALSSRLPRFLWHRLLQTLCADSLDPFGSTTSITSASDCRGSLASCLWRLPRPLWLLASIAGGFFDSFEFSLDSFSDFLELWRLPRSLWCLPRLLWRLPRLFWRLDPFVGCFDSFAIYCLVSFGTDLPLLPPDALDWPLATSNAFRFIVNSLSR